jgi:LCP family protein required for cell wall assembly
VPDSSPNRDSQLTGRVAFTLARRMNTPPDLWEQQPDHAENPVRVRRTRRWPKRLGITLAGLLAAAGAAVGYLYWQADSIVNEFQAGPKRPVVEMVVPELNRQPAAPAPGITKAMTILAIGSDKRAGESNGRSDTMLLVRIDPKTDSVSVLSLPRDLRVPIPGYGEDKINAAYSFGGPGLLTSTIREYLGVPINHFVQVDFRGFGGLVNELGGVYLPVDQRYYHVNDGTAANNWSSIDLRPGYQKLPGDKALEFVRFRHLDTDFHRAARQQLFLREVGRQMQARKTDVVGLPGLLRSVAKATTSDLDSVTETLKIANTLRQVPADRISRVTMTGESVMLNGIYYLQASDQDKQQALYEWSHPGRRQKQHRKEQRAVRHKTSIPLIPSADSSSSIVALLKGLRTCTPTALPAGYRWPSAQDAVHNYRLDDHPAAAMYATKGSGTSVLWTFTTWADPPILSGPTRTQRVGGKLYDFYYESGKLRMVAWRIGSTRAWVTNTLRNELSSQEMTGLARSCQS